MLLTETDVELNPRPWLRDEPRQLVPKYICQHTNSVGEQQELHVGYVTLDRLYQDSARRH